MPFDPHLWTELEQHGVTAAHWQALLRFLRAQENGSFAWHARQGQLERCELKLSYPSRGHTVQRVSQVVLAREEG